MTDKIATLVSAMRTNPAGVRFADALRVAEHYFGPPRINGSHHFFRVPWPGPPLVNLQPRGSRAKDYQIVQLLAALDKLSERGER